MQMHANQVHVDAGLVRALIDGQFPEWNGLPIEPVSGSGTVNAIFRIGHELTARLPLQRLDPSVARSELEREATALTEFASVSPLSAPIPVAIGRPGADYPMPWAVQTWLDGEVATPVSVATSAAVAHDLAELIGTLRSVPTRGRRFRGRGRGGVLRDHDAYVLECIERVEQFADGEPLRALWERLRVLPDGASPVMTHGDLTPWNILVADDRANGVLDAGSFGPADPSLDLVCAWHLFDAVPRAVLREALSAGEVEWRRGAAWAFQQAMGLVWYYRTSNPPMAWLGETTLARLSADDELRS